MHGFSQSVNEICLSRKNERWIFIPSSNCHGLVDPLFMGSLFLMNIISLITSVPNGMVWVFLQKNANHNIKCKWS